MSDSEETGDADRPWDMLEVLPIDVFFHMCAYLLASESGRLATSSKRQCYQVHRFRLRSPRLVSATSEDHADVYEACSQRLYHPPTLAFSTHSSLNRIPPSLSTALPAHMVAMGVVPHQCSIQESMLLGSFHPSRTEVHPFRVPWGVGAPDYWRDELPPGKEWKFIMVFVCAQEGNLYFADSLISKLQDRYPEATVVGSVVRAGFITLPRTRALDHERESAVARQISHQAQREVDAMDGGDGRRERDRSRLRRTRQRTQERAGVEWQRLEMEWPVRARHIDIDRIIHRRQDQPADDLNIGAAPPEPAVERRAPPLGPVRMAAPLDPEAARLGQEAAPLDPVPRRLDEGADDLDPGARRARLEERIAQRAAALNERPAAPPDAVAAPLDPVPRRLDEGVDDLDPGAPGSRMHEGVAQRDAALNERRAAPVAAPPDPVAAPPDPVAAPLDPVPWDEGPAFLFGPGAPGSRRVARRDAALNERRAALREQQRQARPPQSRGRWFERLAQSPDDERNHNIVGVGQGCFGLAFAGDEIPVHCIASKGFKSLTRPPEIPRSPWQVQDVLRVDIRRPYYCVKLVRNSQTGSVVRPSTQRLIQALHPEPLKRRPSYAVLQREGSDQSTHYQFFDGSQVQGHDDYLLPQVDGFHFFVANDEDPVANIESFREAHIDILSVDHTASRKHVTQTLMRLKQERKDLEVIGALVFTGDRERKLGIPRHSDTDEFQRLFPRATCVGMTGRAAIGPQVVPDNTEIFSSGQSLVQNESAMFVVFVAATEVETEFDESDESVSKFIQSKLKS